MVEIVLIIWDIMKLVFAIAATIFAIVGFVFAVWYFANQNKPIKPIKDVLKLRERVAAELKKHRGGYR